MQNPLEWVRERLGETEHTFRWQDLERTVLMLLREIWMQVWSEEESGGRME